MILFNKKSQLRTPMQWIKISYLKSNSQKAMKEKYDCKKNPSYLNEADLKKILVNDPALEPENADKTEINKRLMTETELQVSSQLHTFLSSSSTAGQNVNNSTAPVKLSQWLLQSCLKGKKLFHLKHYVLVFSLPERIIAIITRSHLNHSNGTTHNTWGKTILILFTVEIFWTASQSVSCPTWNTSLLNIHKENLSTEIWRLFTETKKILRMAV